MWPQLHFQPNATARRPIGSTVGTQGLDSPGDLAVDRFEGANVRAKLPHPTLRLWRTRRRVKREQVAKIARRQRQGKLNCYYIDH
jgi:hypothetical protein